MNLYRVRIHYKSRIPWIFKVTRRRDFFVRAKNPKDARKMIKHKTDKFRHFHLETTYHKPQTVLERFLVSGYRRHRN